MLNEITSVRVLWQTEKYLMQYCTNRCVTVTCKRGSYCKTRNWAVFESHRDKNVPSDICAQRRLKPTCVCAQSDLPWSSAWRSFASFENQSMASEDSDQTARMSRLIWILAGRTFPKVCYFIVVLLLFLIIYYYYYLFIYLFIYLLRLLFVTHSSNVLDTSISSNIDLFKS